MKISLIIPAYNEEKYIGTCLESVEKNGAGLFEVIVINNKSTDKTREVALGFPDVLVVDEMRQGLTYSRQCGLQNAFGDILAFIDADTKMPKGWVEKIQKEFQKNKNTVCLSGPYVYYDTSIFEKFLVWVCYIFLYYPAYFFVGYMATGGNFAAKKSALQSIGGFDTTISFYGEDTNTARHLSKVGKVKFDLSFYMYTSARRLKDEGTLRTAYKYVVNFLSIVLKGKPRDSEYKNIR